MNSTEAYPVTKLSPWQHQIDAWQQARLYPGYYYGIDMGGGKTKAAIDYINGTGSKKVLIGCPAKVVDVWPEQFVIHSPIPFVIIGHEFKKSWNTTKKAADIQRRAAAAVKAGVPVAIILNYESIIRPPLGPTRDKRGRIIDPGLLLKVHWDVIVWDEIHKLKAPGGKASFVAKKLRAKAKRVIGLSGTPMPHLPLDIYAQMRAVDPRIYGESYQKFKMRYAVMGGFDGKQVLGYQNEKELHDKFKSRAIIVKKRDIMDLPPFMHIKRRCSLPQAVDQIYTGLAKDFIAQVDNNEITAQNALVKLLRLAQITSGYAQLDDGTEKIIDNTKIDDLIDLMTSLDLDEPLVIVCRFTQELDRIKQAAIDAGRDPDKIGEISGRQNDYLAFKRGDLDTLVVQIQAGNAGIDLTRAAYMVYFSKGFSNGDYQQSLARVDRPGQTRPVTYYHIIAEGTVDERIDRALDKRQTIVDFILNDVQGLLAAKKFMNMARLNSRKVA